MANYQPLMQHLLRRAGFGATPDEIKRYTEMGVSATFNELLDYERVADDVDAKIGRPGYTGTTSPNRQFSPSTVIEDARQRVLFRMVHSGRPLQEKMALFWHNHFATAYSKIAGEIEGLNATRMLAAKPSEHPGNIPGQMELFRGYALGNFRELLVEVAKDPAMLVWLDGRSNVRNRPQENFAREVMELFTMGVGNYVEADVYAGARVFTGWNLQRVGDGRDPNATYYRFAYIPGNHDPTAKEFTFPIYPDGSSIIPARSQADGMQDGLDLLNALSRSPQTARRLARRLWNYFISELDAPDEAFINHLAQVYLVNNTEIEPVVRAILFSREFSWPQHFFRRYSWPVEFVARAMKEVGSAGFSAQTALSPLVNMGQQLFEPPDVNGWDQGPIWFSTGAMLARMNFAAALTRNQSSALASTARGQGPTPEALLSFFLDRLTPADYDADAYNDLLDYLRAGVNWTGSDAQLASKAPNLVHLITGSSEYQFV